MSGGGGNFTNNKVIPSAAQASLKAAQGQGSCCQFTGLAIHWLTASLIPSFCFLDSLKEASTHKLSCRYKTIGRAGSTQACSILRYFNSQKHLIAKLTTFRAGSFEAQAICPENCCSDACVCFQREREGDTKGEKSHGDRQCS